MTDVRSFSLATSGVIATLAAPAFIKTGGFPSAAAAETPAIKQNCNPIQKSRMMDLEKGKQNCFAEHTRNRLRPRFRTRRREELRCFVFPSRIYTGLASSSI